jgi:hypothetical protein
MRPGQNRTPCGERRSGGTQITTMNTQSNSEALPLTNCSLSSAALKVWLECEKDNPFFCRRSIDKSCYEVGKQTNDDWRECISEDRIFLGKFATEEEAQSVYDEHRIKWMWEEICKANAHPDRTADKGCSVEGMVVRCGEVTS